MRFESRVRSEMLACVGMCFTLAGCVAESNPGLLFDWNDIFSRVDLSIGAYSYQFDSSAPSGKKLVIRVGQGCGDSVAEQSWIWGMRVGGSTTGSYRIDSDGLIATGEAMSWLAGADNTLDYRAVAGTINVRSVSEDLETWHAGHPLIGHAVARFPKVPIASGSCQGVASLRADAGPSMFSCACSNANGDEWTCDTNQGSCCLDDALGEIAFETDFEATPCADLCSFVTGEQALAQYCEELYP